jgi:hypothetical protein
VASPLRQRAFRRCQRLSAVVSGFPPLAAGFFALSGRFALSSARIVSLFARASLLSGGSPDCQTALRIRRRDWPAVNSFRGAGSRHLALVRQRLDLVRNIGPPAAAFVLSSPAFRTFVNSIRAMVTRLYAFADDTRSLSAAFVRSSAAFVRSSADSWPS